MDAERRIETYEEFWPFYVGEHRDPTNRLLHCTGTTVALAVAAWALVSGAPTWLLAVPVIGYGPAWFGHFFIERNRPATFRYPLWSLRADFRMLRLSYMGRMGAEVARLYGDVAPSREAPLRSER